MRLRIFWTTMVGVPLALITVAAGTAAALPAARHIASALWNAPDRMTALADNSQIHFELGAEDYARDSRLCCRRPSLGSRQRRDDHSPIQ